MVPPYCHIIDVLRRFDPGLTVSDLEGSGSFVGPDGVQKVEAKIQEAGDIFEDKTRHAFRERRVGAPGRPDTYEHHGVKRHTFRSGSKVWLEHRHVVPIDPDEGDAVEVRIGRDDWRDITGDEGPRWNANYVDGWIRLHSRWQATNRWQKDLRENNIRVTYRYGALGGDRGRGGETALSGSVDDSSAPAVDGPGRLPPRGTVLVGGPENGEYVEYGGIDYTTGELERVSRGQRATAADSREEGTLVHYCPLSVRSAVADKTAVELLTYDDFTNQIGESDNISPSNKVETWNENFEKALQKHSGARSM
jgi:hypothetical protein